MSTLAQQQQALLALLFDWPNLEATQNIAHYIDSDWARGQKVYQSNGHALACRALRAAYPVMAQLLGDESFDALARALWHVQPPLRGDIAQWGAMLCEFVRTSDQLVDEPYLPDVAALEWALHRAGNAADDQVDPGSFALLAQHDPAALRLRLSPGCAVLSSVYPVASIVGAHLQQQPSLAQAGELLRAGVGEDALVWRSGLRPQMRQAQVGEVGFVAALLRGQTLGESLEQATALDIGAWLPMAVQTGLLLQVQAQPRGSAGCASVPTQSDPQPL